MYPTHYYEIRKSSLRQVGLRKPGSLNHVGTFYELDHMLSFVNDCFLLGMCHMHHIRCVVKLLPYHKKSKCHHHSFLLGNMLNRMMMTLAF